MKRIPNFSVLLIMIVMMIIGLGLFSQVSIQYAPTIKQKSISISYGWPSASARVIEQEVTSKIEGAVASVTGVEEIDSQTSQGSGYISLKFKPDRNLNAARFEVATMLRQIYGSLPEGVSYPSLSTSVNSSNSSPILTYTLNSSLAANKIEKYAQDNILKELAKVKGINDVSLSGTSPFVWEITYDYNKASFLGITPSDIREAVKGELSMNSVIGTTKDGGDRNITISVVGSNYDSVTVEMFDAVIVKNVNGRIVSLGDVASVVYKEKLPNSYFRINGLNTVTISIFPEKGINTLEVVKNVKELVKHIEEGFGADFSIMLSYDSSVYINEELDKIYFRTILSLIILLMFVFAVSRSFKYLFVIFLTLLANVLIAFIFFYFAKVELHLYSLAGITVSLGVMIDTSIIMADHYNYYHNRKAFNAILGALLTTIGSLVIVFFLPEGQRENLIDFSIVIMINLSVSLLIALMFIPALLDNVAIKPRVSKNTRRRLRRISRFTRYYKNYIVFGRRHKVLTLLIIVLMFGLPVFMLPLTIKNDDKSKNEFLVDLYNKSLGSKFYTDKIKSVADIALGGTLRLFVNGVSQHGGYREPERTKLYINAAMPEGCSVHQLNEVMRMMENYLSGFEDIEMFQTRIYSYDNGSITVTFKKDVEKGGFPYRLQSMAISKAINYGGATWSIYGVSKDGFNNNIYSGFKSNRITLTGYNYDKLYAYAQQLVDSLKSNRRVSDIGIYGEVYYGSVLSRTEYFVDYDREKIALKDINLAGYFNYLNDQLYSANDFTSVFDSDGMTGVSLLSNEKENFDIWHIKNDLIQIDSQSVRLSDFGTIEKRLSGNDIYKYNQEYILKVAYDFIGTYELAHKISKRYADYFTEHVLPIGYKVHDESFNFWRVDSSKQYYLLALVILIIYFICAILFESLLKPLVIIMLIPVSFVGLFLLFYIGEFHFDQGGFASFVLLCGVVVNAGIYIINEYSLLRKGYSGREDLSVYLTAYNRKIIPIMLTIISTVLGLLPFLYDGPDEVFWFSFAIGSIGGILFSIVALVFFMPILMPFKKKNTKLK